MEIFMARLKQEAIYTNSELAACLRPSVARMPPLSLHGSIYGVSQTGG